MKLKTDNIIYEPKRFDGWVDLARPLDKLGCKWADERQLTAVDFSLYFNSRKHFCIYVSEKIVYYGDRVYYKREYPTTEIVKYSTKDFYENS